MLKKITVCIFILFASYALLGPTRASAEIDELLTQYETGDKEFEKKEIGDKIVYRHDRTIDGVIVDGDYIVYIFDIESEELVEKIAHWREDLPEHITVNITKEQAETIAGGEVLFSKLRILSPDAPLTHIDPTPENPCWLIRVIENDYQKTIIVDAVTGELLGYGIPPPFASLSFTGPFRIHEHNCNIGWSAYYRNAEEFFNDWGYNCEGLYWPTHDDIRSHLQSFESALLYEIAHSNWYPMSYSFASGCIDNPEPENDQFEHTTATDIEGWLQNYPKMPFTFIASCNGMCDTGPNTLSYAFRKGSNDGAVTVGYCHMGDVECADCWDSFNAYRVQLMIFLKMEQDYTVGEAFDYTMQYYSNCMECFGIAGDESMALPFERYHCPDIADYEYLPGDANMFWGIWPPEAINSDLTYLVSYFRGLNPPCELDGYYASADVNGDCVVIGSDITWFTNYFKGLCELKWCPDYETWWPKYVCVPEEAPFGWPYCEPLATGNVIPNEALEK